MPKRFSSVNACVRFALALARDEKFEKALRTLRHTAGRHLNSDDLRLVAQIYNRCGMLDAAERCWNEIERRGEIEPGDYYMLGSLQSRLSHDEFAARSYEREVDVSLRSKDQYYLSSAAIRLVELMLRAGNLTRAKDFLIYVNKNEREYLQGKGFRTKANLRDEIDRAERNGG